MDKNRDNYIDYKEFMDEFAEAGQEEAMDNNAGNDAEKKRDSDDEGAKEIPTVEPYGHDEIRTIQLRRMRLGAARAKEERETFMKQETEAAKQMFFESVARAERESLGGANPKWYRVMDDVKMKKEEEEKKYVKSDVIEYHFDYGPMAKMQTAMRSTPGSTIITYLTPAEQRKEEEGMSTKNDGPAAAQAAPQASRFGGGGFGGGGFGGGEDTTIWTSPLLGAVAGLTNAFAWCRDIFVLCVHVCVGGGGKTRTHWERWFKKGGREEGKASTHHSRCIFRSCKQSNQFHTGLHHILPCIGT